MPKKGVGGLRSWEGAVLSPADSLRTLSHADFFITSLNINVYILFLVVVVVYLASFFFWSAWWYLVMR